MLFKRREKPDALDVVRSWLWPRRGWRRAWGYVWHRMTRLPGSAHAIALGFSVGAFSAFTPFVGLHFILAAVTAYLVGGNVIASALGTFVGNPLTFPLIWFGTYKAGTALLGMEGRENIDLEESAEGLWTVLTSPSLMWTDVWSSLLPLIGPMLIGAVVIGGPVAAAIYVIVRVAVQAYQRKRRERIAEQSRLRHHAGIGHGDGNETGQAQVQ